MADLYVARRQPRARSAGVSMSRTTPGSSTVDELERAAVGAHDRPRPGVAGSAASAAPNRAREPTGWPRSPRVARRGDRRAAGEPRGDAPDRVRTDERHVGERDDPAARVAATPGPRARASSPMPSAARSHTVTSAPAARGALRERPSAPGRTTATTRGTRGDQIAQRTRRRSACRRAADGAACRSRSAWPTPPARRMPTIARGTGRCGSALRYLAAEGAKFGSAGCSSVGRPSRRGAPRSSRRGSRPRSRAASWRRSSGPTGPCSFAISPSDEVEAGEPLAARVVVLLRAERADVEARRLERLEQRGVVELRIVRHRDHRAVRRPGSSATTVSSG